MNCKIGFIGAGNMAGAIMKGISKCGYDLYAYDINSEKVAVLAAYGVKSMPSAQALAQRCDFIFLAVKPQNFDQVLPMIKTHINQQAVIVSIAAGITPSYIKTALDYDAKVVQVMPNTPLLLGVGATAMAKAEPTTEQEFDAVADIFGQLGIVCKLALDKMNEIC